MPPRSRITKEMVIQAGFKILRGEGQECLNVRRIAAELGCSTQPVMYHYSTVEELKADIYTAADSFHTEFIMRPDEGADNPMLSIGLNYIRFAYEERYLFRFLFQSDKFRNISFRELLEGEGAELLLEPLTRQTGLTLPQAKEVFETLFICAHGYASLLANNSVGYDREHCAGLLTTTFMGMISSITGGEKG